MFKFLHAADLHLDSPMRGLERYEGAPVDQIRGATRRALENLVRLAVDEGVKFVLVAGDLYDQGWKDYNTALFLSGQMARLRDAGIGVFVIAGNHDASSQITRSLHLPENVRLLSTKAPETIMLGDVGVAIHGQGFAERAVREDLSAGYPSGCKDLFNIGMLHTAATGREGHEPYAPCSVDGLLSRGYDYWALGHVHRREVLHENPWIVFPGNIQGRHVNESGRKGCTLVTVEDGSCSLAHRDLSVVAWAVCEIDTSGADEPEGVLDLTRMRLQQELLNAGGQLLAARILLSGSTNAHTELINDQERWVNEIRSVATDLSDGAIWIEQVKLRTRPHIDMEERLTHDDPVADLLRHLQGLEPDGDLLKPVRDEVAAIRSKVAELFELTPALNLDSPEVVRGVLEEVKAILIARILSAGGAQ
jgi:DNA repair exonuclease SbcCD nuclease subunit